MDQQKISGNSNFGSFTFFPFPVYGTRSPDKADDPAEPRPPFEVMITDAGPVETINRFSGESTMLTPTAAAVHDCIWGSLLRLEKDNWNIESLSIVSQGKAWFLKHYPTEYWILLD